MMTPDAVRLAEDLGYPDTWSMSRGHEIAHTWLAVEEGYPFSLTLRQVAHQGEAPVLTWGQVAYEEAKVLAWQRDSKSRPWIEVEQ